MATQKVVGIAARRVRDGQRVPGKPHELGAVGLVHCGGDKGTLYVVAHVQGDLRAEIEQQLVDAVTDYFHRSTDSTTKALKDAIKAANRLLYQANQKAMFEQQTRAGIFCVAVRPDTQPLLGYAGPGVALLISPLGVEHLPSGSEPQYARQVGKGADGDYPLGVNPTIEPYLFRSQFDVGEMMVIGSPSLLALSDEELENCLREEGLDGLPADIDGTILMFTLAEEEVAAQPAAGALGRDEKKAQGGPHWQLPPFLSGRARQAASSPAPVVGRPSTDPLPSFLDRTPAPHRRARPVFAMPSLQMPALSLSKVGGRGLLLVAAAVILIVVAAVVVQRQMQAQALEREFQTLITDAQEKRTLGQASLDRTEAVVYLKDAGLLVDQALQLRVEDTTALALRDSIRRDMDQAKGITRLEANQVVVLHTFAGPGAGPSRVVGDGFNLYVLDKGEQKVHKFVLNAMGNGIQQSSDTVLVRKGDQVGAAVLSDLVDIAWIPQGGIRAKSVLMILDSAGNLVEYDVQQGLRLLPIRDARTWRKVQATSGYGGNFYILDTVANSIVRYRPQGRGYEGAPSPYLQTKVELVNAVDMAIDGDVFVLLINGQVLWLSGGKPQAFALEGLDRPMTAPVAIFTNTGTESVYVADPANARVAQFSKQGVTQRQLVYEGEQGNFQRLRGVFVDEKKQALYVTAGTALLYVGLPK